MHLVTVVSTQFKNKFPLKKERSVTGIKDSGQCIQYVSNGGLPFIETKQQSLQLKEKICFLMNYFNIDIDL